MLRSFGATVAAFVFFLFATAHYGYWFFKGERQLVSGPWPLVRPWSSLPHSHVFLCRGWVFPSFLRQVEGAAQSHTADGGSNYEDLIGHSDDPLEGSGI